MLQSTLDFLEHGYDVHVLADGVSSCNKEEVPLAIERMRQAGAQITTNLVRARCSSYKVCTLCPIFSMGDTKDERRLVICQCD